MQLNDNLSNNRIEFLYLNQQWISEVPSNFKYIPKQKPEKPTKYFRANTFVANSRIM